MSELRKAAQQALEALVTCRAEEWRTLNNFGMKQVYDEKKVNAAIAALHAALVEPEQEPVGWQWLDTANYRKKLPADAIPEHWRPLYTAPPQRKPVELTDDEIALIVGECAASAHRYCDFSFARAVIAAYEAKQGEQT